jgi:hypothetical protein
MNREPMWLSVLVFPMRAAFVVMGLSMVAAFLVAPWVLIAWAAGCWCGWCK